LDRWKTNDPLFRDFAAAGQVWSYDQMTKRVIMFLQKQAFESRWLEIRGRWTKTRHPFHHKRLIICIFGHEYSIKMPGDNAGVELLFILRDYMYL